MRKEAIDNITLDIPKPPLILSFSSLTHNTPFHFTHNTMATLSFSLVSKTLKINPSHPKLSTPLSCLSYPLCSLPFTLTHNLKPTRISSQTLIRAAVDGDYSSKRSSSNEPRETIMLPGCDYNHWLIVMEFPKDPAPTREQMIDTYLQTLATVLGRSLFLYPLHYMYLYVKISSCFCFSYYYLCLVIFYCLLLYSL